MSDSNKFKTPPNSPKKKIESPPTVKRIPHKTNRVLNLEQQTKREIMQREEEQRQLQNRRRREEEEQRRSQFEQERQNAIERREARKLEMRRSRSIEHPVGEKCYKIYAIPLQFWQLYPKEELIHNWCLGEIGDTKYNGLNWCQKCYDEALEMVNNRRRSRCSLASIFCPRDGYELPNSLKPFKHNETVLFKLSDDFTVKVKIQHMSNSGPYHFIKYIPKNIDESRRFLQFIRANGEQPSLNPRIIGVPFSRRSLFSIEQSNSGGKKRKTRKKRKKKKGKKGVTKKRRKKKSRGNKKRRKKN